jgi:hypothetical protein
MEERGFEQSLSVFICVHLWLHCMVTAEHRRRNAATATGRLLAIHQRAPRRAKTATATLLSEISPRAGQR